MIRAGIVGLGRWGQVLARAVHDRSERIAVTRGVTRTPARAEDFARATGIPVGDDYQALLADPQIDAVILATPHSQHVAQIEAAAAAGKHVFVEKPLALDAAGAIRAYRAADAAGVVLALGHNRRFLPAWAALKGLVDDGRLGRLLHVEGNFSGPGGFRHQPGGWRASTAESPAGGMTGMGVHVTDLMIELLGPAVEVDARSYRQAVELETDDTTVMLLRFRDGQSGTMSTLTATPSEWRIQLFGTGGWAEIRRQTELTVAYMEGAPETRRFAPVDIERAELEAFADCIENGAPWPVRPATAIANTALLEAIGRSAARGGAVSIPEGETP